MKFLSISLATALLGAVFGIGCNNAAPPTITKSVSANAANTAGAPNAAAKPADPSDHTGHGHDTNDGAVRVSPAEAKAAVDAGKAVIIDTRPATAYETERIKGSINVSLEQFDAMFPNFPADKQLIFYCS